MRKGVNSVILFVLRNIWLEQNRQVFKHTSLSMELLTDKIKVQCVERKTVE